MTEATNRCIAFEHAARQEAARQAVQDGTDASDAGYIERFVRVAVLQERHRAAQTLAGAAAPAPPLPPPLPPTSERPFYEARAKAAYAKRPPTRGEEPLVDVRGESYRRVLRDSPILAKSDARALARAAARGMVGAFRNNGSTTLGCAAPDALRGRLDDESIAIIRRCVVELRRLAAESAGVDERRLALSGAFLARLQPPGASARRRALESTPRCYWNLHVDEYNVATYEHTTLLYLSDHGSDFTGGRFVFYDGDGVDRHLEPSAGTVICFRGDAANLHAVEKVSSGCRFALTALFHATSDPGPLFEAGGGGGDPYASWDALLRSAAETSLMAQDARRRELLDDASPTPVAARLATDLRGDWCDARVSYDGEVVSDTGLAPDAVLVDLVAAALRTDDGGAFDVFGESSDDDGGPLLLTYAAACGAHGPSGTLSWRRARYTLLDGGEEVASCECEVTPTGSGAQKRLVFGGDITVVVDELAATASNSGTGHALWPGAVALALWVVGRGSAARTVVELGCGACALPGRAAAALGGTVTLTDGAPALLPVLRKLDGVDACLYNFAGGGAFDGLDDASAEPSEPPAPADLVLGAEIAYRAADAEALAACIPNRLAPGGTAVLCSDEKRAPLKLCGELLRKRGFVVEDSVLTLTVTPEGEAATTHRVRVVRARRSSSSSVGAS
jgi:hypothetical protein